MRMGPSTSTTAFLKHPRAEFTCYQFTPCLRGGAPADFKSTTTGFQWPIFQTERKVQYFLSFKRKVYTVQSHLLLSRENIRLKDGPFLQINFNFNLFVHRRLNGWPEHTVKSSPRWHDPFIQQRWTNLWGLGHPYQSPTLHWGSGPIKWQGLK